MALPTYSKTVNTVFTLAARLHLKTVFTDNFYTRCPALTALRSKKISKPGGDTLVVPVKVGASALGGYYDRFGTLNMQDVDDASEAQYNWAFSYEPIVISHQDYWKCRGSDVKMKELTTFKTDDAIDRLKTAMATALYAASPATNALQGLPVAIADAPSSSGAYGLLDGASTAQSGWRNYTNTSVGSFASNGVDALTTMFRYIADNSDVGKPQWAFTDPTTWGYIHSKVIGHYDIRAQVTNETDRMYADLGFQVLNFMGTTIVSDRYCTSGTIYCGSDAAAQLVEMEGAQIQLHPDGFVSGLSNNQMCWKSAVIANHQFVTYERRGLGKASGITA